MTDVRDEDAQEANLSQLSDEQWLEGHEQLVELGIPAEETTFVWDPELPASALINPAETEEAPRG